MYTSKDLDNMVNEEETLLQFIQNSSLEFYGLKPSREYLESYSDEELNSLINELDYLWTK